MRAAEMTTNEQQPVSTQSQGTTSELFSALEGVTIRNGITYAGPNATIPRGDAVKHVGKSVLAFRTSHKKNKTDRERAILHGRLDFANVTQEELLELASAKVIAGFVQKHAAVSNNLAKDVENRTWNVRQWLDLLKAPKGPQPVTVDKAVETVMAGVDKLSDEQKAALRALLGG